MTFIPAENDPEETKGSSQHRGSRPEPAETPTEAISTTQGDQETISASADPTVTRPLPSVSGQQREQRYDLSPDPATAAIDTPPWQDPDPRTEPMPAYNDSRPSDQEQNRGGQGTGTAGFGHAPSAVPATQRHASQPRSDHQGPAPVRGGQPQNSGYAASSHGHTGNPVAYPSAGTHPGSAGQQGVYPAGPQGHDQTAAARAPRRDLSFGIFVGQLLRAAIVLALAGGVAYYALRTVGGQWADELALQEGERALNQVPSAWVPWLDLIPVAVCVLWGVVALICAVAANRWIPLLVALGTGFGAVVTVQLLKRDLLNKAPLGIQETALNSLPSGHTAAAATAAVIAVMVAPARIRGIIAFFAALTTALAGISTVLNGWHRPMDAVVAILVVTVWAILGALLLRCLVRPEPWRTNRAIGTLVIGILFVLGAGAGLAAMQTMAVDGLALATGGAAIIGVSLLCAHQTVRALRPRRRVA